MPPLESGKPIRLSITVRNKDDLRTTVYRSPFAKIIIPDMSGIMYKIFMKPFEKLHDQYDLVIHLAANSDVRTGSEYTGKDMEFFEGFCICDIPSDNFYRIHFL